MKSGAFVSSIVRLAIALLSFYPMASNAEQIAKDSTIIDGLQPIVIRDVTSAEVTEKERDSDWVSVRLKVKMTVEGNIKSGDPNQLLYFQNRYADSGHDPETIRIFAKKKSTSTKLSDGHEFSAVTPITLEFDSDIVTGEPRLISLISQEVEFAKVKVELQGPNGGTPKVKIVKK